MQKILGQVRRCVEDYHMIDAGDVVAVGVSGGKDSLVTLTALARLRVFYPIPFTVRAITLETGAPGMSFDAVADLCRQLEVPYTRIQVPVYDIVFNQRKEKNPCSLCAKLRRGSLNTALTDLGIRKIALGHHYDDAIETLLMNLLFEGRIGCFQPVTYLDRTGITQIRPLLYCREEEIRRVARRISSPGWRAGIRISSRSCSAASSATPCTAGIFTRRSGNMKTRLGGRTWAALLTFGLFGQIAWVIENMYFNVFLYNTISGDTSMIAAMVAWSAVTATVTTLVMGALSDRLGRRKALIVIGYLLWGVSIGAFAFIKRSPLAGAAHGAAVLVVVMDCVMTFFGSTANDAAFNAWVTDVTVPENRGRVETVLAIMPLVAMLVVFGALDGLTQAGNWRLFFLIVGGITCLGGVLGCFFIREPDLPRGQGSYFANILYGFRPAVVRDNPRLYLSLAALGVYCMSQQVYMPYLIIYIQRFLGITDYTLLLAGVLIVSSVLSVLAGRPIDRFGKLRCLVPAGIVGFAGLVLMYFARSQWFVLAAGIVMLGGGMVISACCNGLIRDYTPAGKAGLFQGIRIVFQVLLPMVTGPYIGAAVIRGTGMTYEDLGTVKQVPTAEIFLAAAAALVLLAIPAALLKRKETVK